VVSVTVDRSGGNVPAAWAWLSDAVMDGYMASLVPVDRVGA
jgi:hypothetical protein